LSLTGNFLILRKDGKGEIGFMGKTSSGVVVYKKNFCFFSQNLFNRFIVEVSSTSSSLSPQEAVMTW
jgi:hypothetical protein